MISPDFILKNQKVYFQDSRSFDFIDKESIQLIVTSPPYWNAKDYTHNKEIKQIGFGESYELYLESLFQVFTNCIDVLTPNGKIAIVIQPLPASGKETGIERSSIIDIMADVYNFLLSPTKGLNLCNQFIWDKRRYNNQRIFGSYPYPPNLFSHVAWEMIYVFRKKGNPIKREKHLKEQSKLTMEELKQRIEMVSE
ncbi:MAG: DNA methyltransferase [Candidatus Hodarchaeales archaeon]|jgi:DNA modification methylase